LEVVSVTKKGQATIPKRLREKYGIRSRVLVMEGEEGIVLKPLPKPEEEFSSLKQVFRNRRSKDLLKEARREEEAKEKKRGARIRASNL